jgi:hypothetical protein
MASENKWLLLLQQLPSRPSGGRVKTWRRMQQLGAVPLKNSAYVLPNTPQSREDFEWMRTEIIAMKGQASVFAADAVDASEHQELVAAFRAARDRDYRRLRADLTRLERQLKGGRVSGGPLMRAQRTTRALRERLAALHAIDFFSATGRQEAIDALASIEQHLTGARAPAKGSDRMSAPGLDRRSYQRRLWVTRPRPGIDRMSSAWLIRRFIDPRARFVFAERAAERDNGIPFDMFQGEFRHREGRCTFEELVHRFRISDPAVTTIAEIVHDVDLKDHRYGRVEGPVVNGLVEGLRAAHAEDETLLERGIELFETLYRGSAVSAPAAKTRGRTRQVQRRRTRKS